MSYDYYCTHCGKKLSQSGSSGTRPVLFDLSPLITQTAFNLLRFRVTEQELRKLVEGGAPASDGYRTVSISFSDFMRVLANENNNNKPIIANVTLEELRSYLNANTSLKDGADNSDEPDDGGLSLSGLTGEAETETGVPETPEAPAAEAPEQSEALHELLALENAMIGEHLIGGAESDIRILNTAFAKGSVTLDIKLYFEKDTDGNDVLIDYIFRRAGIVNRQEKVRVCPECGKKVFLYAGTAEHRTVAFIADSGAGKTSTILALSHYVFNAVIGTFGGGIWANADTIPDVVGLPSLLEADPNPVPDMKHDLDLFKQGIAPDKTKDKKDATYNSTFRIKTKRGKKEVYTILTLVDIPGELCLKAGEPGVLHTGLNTNALLNKYQIALNCDAYVVCFDTTKIVPEDGLPASEEQDDAAQRNDESSVSMSSINNVCVWAEEFQKLNEKSRQGGQIRYVPMMVLFMKCSEIEVPGWQRAARSKNALPIEQTYLFFDERSEMELDSDRPAKNPKNNLYRFAEKLFRDHGTLKNGYFSVLRCSPYGYKAPSETAVNEAKKKDPKKKINRDPTPKNIDKLMRWILSVSSCIPVQGKYLPGDDHSFELADYYFTRPQCRADAPSLNDHDKEALARCALFVNRGTIDERLVLTHYNWADRLLDRSKWTISPKSFDNQNGEG